MCIRAKSQLLSFLSLAQGVDRPSVEDTPPSAERRLLTSPSARCAVFSTVFFLVPLIHIPQVTQFLQAAKEDAVGTYAVGAFERIMTASEEALKIMSASSLM